LIASDLARTEGSIIDAITILVKRDYPQSSVLLEKLLVQKLNNGKCLLLFDAWDEVPQKQRCSLLRKLDLFVEQFIERKSNQIILTSRIVGYRGSIMNGAKEVEIVPFNQWQKEKYIETWFANGTDYIDNSSISPQRLISELRQKPQISGLAQNPLLLSLICSLYQQKGLRLPARRCQLYRESLNYMLSKWQLDNRRSSGEEETWIIAKRRLLEFLAYQFTSEGKEWFWRKEPINFSNQVRVPFLKRLILMS
jgi:predicted NACHT family NTPase